MIGKKYKRYQYTEESILNHQLAEWAFGSHLWDEVREDKSECRWCKRCHTTQMPITAEYPLCPGNPVLKTWIGSVALEATLERVQSIIKET